MKLLWMLKLIFYKKNQQNRVRKAKTNKGFTLRKWKKGKNMRRINAKKRNEINQEIQNAFDRGISTYKAFKESNFRIILICFFKKNKIYIEDNAFGNKREDQKGIQK